MVYENKLNIAVFFDLDGIWFRPDTYWLVRNARLDKIGSKVTWHEVSKHIPYLRKNYSVLNLDEHYLLPDLNWDKIPHHESLNITPPEYLFETVRRHNLKGHDLFLISQVNCRELLDFIVFPTFKIKSKYFNFQNHELEHYKSTNEMIQNQIQGLQYIENIQKAQQELLKKKQSEEINEVEPKKLNYREKFSQSEEVGEGLMKRQKETPKHPFENVTFVNSKPFSGSYSLKEKVSFLFHCLRKKKFIPNQFFEDKLSFNHYDQIFLYYTEKDYPQILFETMNTHIDNLNTQRRYAIIPSFIAEVV